MRKIRKIIVHCTMTKPSMDIGVKEIRNWHINENNWSDVGYHKIIRRSGEIEDGRPIHRPGAHVQGENFDSIGIAWVGGMAEESSKAEDNRTADQTTALFNLLQDLQQQYPGAAILGHRDVKGVKKQCPSFDVRQWYTEACIEKGKKEQSAPTVRPSTIFRYLLLITWRLWRHHRSSRRRSEVSG